MSREDVSKPDAPEEVVDDGERPEPLGAQGELICVVDLTASHLAL
jgi:hypothetical protein